MEKVWDITETLTKETFKWSGAYSFRDSFYYHHDRERGIMQAGMALTVLVV